MLSSAMFYWLAPIIMGIFALVFSALAFTQRDAPAARRAAAGFGLAFVSSCIDTARAPDNSGLMVIATLVHWAAIMTLLSAFLSRHLKSLPLRAFLAIMIPGMAVHVWSGLITPDPVIGVANVNIVGAALMTIVLVQLWPHRGTLADRLVLFTLGFGLLAYLSRAAMFLPTAAERIEAPGTFWSDYNLALYLSSGVTALLIAIVLLVAIGHDMLRERDRLSNTDALTGIANRRAFDGWIAEAARGVRTVGHVIAIDLDHFKRINDRHGHAAGDAVLVAAAGALARGCDEHVLLARTGGEEFAALVAPGADPEQAADRMRHALTQLGLTGEFANLQITASFGCAEVSETDLQAALRSADAALYQAKRSGRDMIIVYGADEKAGVAVPA